MSPRRTRRTAGCATAAARAGRGRAASDAWPSTAGAARGCARAGSCHLAPRVARLHRLGGLHEPREIDDAVAHALAARLLVVEPLAVTVGVEHRGERLVDAMVLDEQP